MATTTDFAGFPKDTLKYLRNLEANNNKEWFNNNKDFYKEAYTLSAKTFCDAIAAGLKKLTRKEHSSKIFRINRDLRFSKDKTPYNTHIRIAFTPSTARPTDPGWFFGLETKKLTVGAGVMDFGKQLDAYRKRVSGKSGSSLANKLEELEDEGIAVYGDPELKRIPLGYADDHPRGELLRRKSLSIWKDFSSRKLAHDPEFVDICLEEYRTMKPVYDWLARI